MTNKFTDPIHYLDATALAELIRTRQLSSREVVQAHLDRISAVNPKINAVVTLTAENALEAADAADKAVASGAKLGPLHGVPFTAKDSIDTANVPTQRGSPIFKGRVPDTDATSVSRMKEAAQSCSRRQTSPNFPTGLKAIISSPAGRTILGISSVRRAARAAVNRRLSRPACRLSDSAPISPSPCADLRRKPGLSPSRPRTGASR